MKTNKFNLGKALSKDELKKIKGGTPICNVGPTVKCICQDGNHICDFGDGVSTSAVICVRDNACVNHGGYANSGCVNPPCS
jgi:hypothetical protein